MKKLKIVDDYILKQLLETFLVGIVIFTSIMFASETFITLVKQISMYGIPFNVAILIVILQLPTMLVFTIPMGVLLSTVMTINKMCTASEITVMRACGIGVMRLSRSVLAFGVAAAILSFVVNEMVVPAANSQAKILTLWALSQKNIPDGKQNFTFKEMNGPVLKRMFYISSVEDKKLNGVTVLDLSKKDTIQVIQSKSGKSSPEFWTFNKGAIYTISSSGKVLNTTLFDSLNVNNTMDLDGASGKHKEKEFNFINLSSFIREQQKELKNRKSEAEKSVIVKAINKLSVALHEKFALPTTAFVFTLIGIPLAITPPRVRFNRGFLFSILILFCYYIIRAFSISLGEAGILDSLISAWLPNIILGSLGLWLLYKKAYTL